MPIQDRIVFDGLEWAFRWRMHDASRIGQVVVVLSDYSVAPKNQECINPVAF
jgi:hypothetical protein